MKCQGCQDEMIVFTVIPEMNDHVAWASHVISEIDGKCGLYHYQCGRVNLTKTAIMFTDLVNDRQ